MEQPLLEPRQILSCLAPIQKYPISKGWTFPSPEALWPPYPRHPSCPFSQEWQQKMEEVERQTNATQESITTYYNTHAYPTEIEIGSNVAIQNPRTKFWDIYGSIIDISPNRRYYIKTSSGRVLVRNRRFLRRRFPLSIPPPPHNSIHDSPADITTSPHHSDITTPPRHSTRLKRPTRRLIEDPTWN